MSEALKPCPFCGSTDLGSGGDDKFVGYWCKNCEATGPNHYSSRHCWNARADLSARVAELEAERDEALNQLDSERHSVSVLEGRNLALLNRVEAAAQRAATLEAKLAKAVDFVLSSIGYAGNSGDDFLADKARATLAEITETKENDT